MPFVTDIAGPQQPVQTWPPLVTGALRRTSTIDTHPAGTGNSDVDLRARDVVASAPDTVDVLGELVVRAHLSDRVIDDIAATPRDGRLTQLLGSRVGPGFRSTVGKLFPEEVQRAGLLHLLLDDWVGAALVSGYGVQHAAINLGIEEKLPAGTADRMAGICAGFAADASLVPYAKRNGTIPSVHGPIAPPLDPQGWHTVEPLRPHGMRRFRTLDLGPRTANSTRTSATRTSTVTASRRSCTSTPSRARSTRRREPSHRLTANVRVLPWQECPGAIGSAARISGNDAVGDA